MNYKILIIFSFLAVNLIASNKSFDYYADGVYDTYTEVENSLRRGLKEKKLKDLKNKWIIVQDISNDSTVQLIFYRTVASKNNFFEAVIAKNLTNNKNYLIYGAYSRKADAIYASKRLLDKGINIQVRFNDNNDEYTNNPIVIKKLIQDMKKLLQDTPMIVVKKTEIIEKEVSSEKKQKTKIVYVEKKKCSNRGVSRKSVLSSIVRSEFKKVKARFAIRGKIDSKHKMIVYREQSGTVNKFKEKDFFKGFKITAIYYNKQTGYRILKLMGLDGKTYKIYKKAKSECDCDKKAKNAETHKLSSKKQRKEMKGQSVKKVAKKQRSTKKTTQNSSVYKCNFNKISNVYTRDGSQKDIKDTHYANKIMLVKLKKEGSRYSVKHAGYEEVYIKPFFKRFCEKQQ